MAENLYDGEFWLPSEFLAEEDIAVEGKQQHGTGFKVNRANSVFGYGFDTNGFSSALFPSQFTYGAGVYSDLSSPVESLVGASETESEEEEHIAELTRRMAHSTLDVGFDNTGCVLGFEKSKGRCLSGSPQSTLCHFGSECGCSHGSPASACQFPSPRATWDLLHAAAGEVERLRLKGEAYRAHHSRGLLGPQRTPSPVTVPAKDSTIDLGFYPYQSLYHQQLQVAKILKQKQMLRKQDSVWGGQDKLTGASPRRQQQQQRQTNRMVPNRRGRVNEMVGVRNGKPVGLSSSALHSLQQAPKQNSHRNGSEMRVLFLGNSGGKKECAGTGVFLPRQLDNQTETRRKPACSTVLVPAKVMQALNLKVDDMVSAEPQYGSRFHGGLDADFAVKLRLRSNNVLSQNRNNMRAQQRPVNHEIQLPQEWTY